MTITEKVAYLKGLIEGMEINADTKEGKILKAIMDVLSDVALSVEDLEMTVEEMGEQVDTIDEDLDTLETEYYGDDYDDCDCCDCDCDDYDMEDTFEVECPKCGDTICFDESIDRENLICPACGEKISIKCEE